MFAARRTEIQIVLVGLGMLVWGYGQRADDEMIRYIGIGMFAAATLLRLAKPKDPPDIEDHTQ